MFILQDMYLPQLRVREIAMKDQYGRTIDYMRVSLTDRCNLRCRYCMPKDIELAPMEEILTLEQIEQICRAAAAAGIRRLKLTGGEPLVRLGCTGLVGRLKKIPGIEQVTLTTNGVLLKQYLPELLEAGLDGVNISLDTLSETKYEQITGRAELAQVLQSLDAALETGLKVKVNTVLQKDLNLEEWRSLVELAREKPLDVRFIEMMPIGFGKEFEPVSNERILVMLKEAYPGLERDERIHGNGPAVYYRIPGFLGSIGLISAIHGKFCSECNRIRLTSRGQIKPCLCYRETVDLKEVLDRDLPEEQKEQLLLESIERAVFKKPLSHSFEDRGRVTEELQMVSIGG